MSYYLTSTRIARTRIHRCKKTKPPHSEGAGGNMQLFKKIERGTVWLSSLLLRLRSYTRLKCTRMFPTAELYKGLNEETTQMSVEMNK